jgi:hypothetical protein
MHSDPVCFDIKSGTNSKDYRIVKIDHGEILCNYRVKVVKEIAPSFSHLVCKPANVRIPPASENREGVPLSTPFPPLFLHFNYNVLLPSETWRLQAF